MAVTLLVPAAGQVAILQLRFVEGEGAVRSPGSRAPRPLTVQVTDDLGKPVAGAAVSFHLPEDGAGAVFAHAMHTDVAVTDAQGLAAMPPIVIGRVSGPFQIRVVAVKEQARAGAVAAQYVAEALHPAPTASRGHGRWIAVAVAVGGGAAAGIVAGARKTSSAAAAPPTPPPAAPAVTIGTPTTTVGRP